MHEKKLTGYPSIDKPWLKYYSEEEKNVKVPKGSMFDYLYERNVMYPNDIAIEYYGHNYTYRKLFYLIDKCCRNLTSLGVKKGDIVTVQAISLPQVVVLIYALTRIGACGNMLYPDAKAKDVVASMKKTNSRLLISVDKLLSLYEEDLPNSFKHTIILINVADEMSVFPKLFARRKAAYKQKNLSLNTISWKEFICAEGMDYQQNHDDTIPAFMLRTGGTTGIPKEVVLTSASFNAIAEGTYRAKICKNWERQKTDVMLLPPFIAFGISSGIHNALSYGLKTVITLDISPSAVSKLFIKYKPCYIIAGTVQIEQLITDLKSKKLNLMHIKLLSVGGEAMNLSFEEKLLAFLKEHKCETIPLKGYGLTETSATVTVERINANKQGSVGIPLSLCNMKIVDPETGKELTYNTPGEICLSSPGIMQGYYQNKEATDEMIKDVDGEKWLHTGDMGIISEDGLLTITGRIKRIITCREEMVYHKVFPQLIEDKLSQITGVKEISIVGRHDETYGNVLIGYVVPEKPDSHETVVALLKNYCSDNLESYECPVDFVCLNSLPRTMIGKVDYRALEKQAEEINKE